jgi:hypothetical protein
LIGKECAHRGARIARRERALIVVGVVDQGQLRKAAECIRWSEPHA